MPDGTQPNLLDAIIERNYFGPNFGDRATSGVFLSHYNMRGAYLVRNNVFEGQTSNGLITTGCGNGATVQIHNNTFILSSGVNAAMSLGGSYGTYAIDSRGNLVVGGALYAGNYVGVLTLTSDRNLVFGNTSNPVTWSATNSGGGYNWAAWQGLGYDANSKIAQDPLLGTGGRPGIGSPAIGAGADLSAFFSDDYDEVTRVAPWDIGAYEFQTSPDEDDGRP